MCSGIGSFVRKGIVSGNISDIGSCIRHGIGSGIGSVIGSCISSFILTMPRAGLRLVGSRLIVRRVQFSSVQQFSRLASRLRRSAPRGQIVLQKIFKRWLTCL